MPAIVRAKAERAFDRRGLRATVDDASLTFGGAAIEDVVVEGIGGGLRIAIREVEVDGGWLALAMQGTAAIEAVRVRGATVHVDAAHPGLSRSVQSIRRAMASATPEELAEIEGDGRSIEVSDLAVRVDDADGALVRVEGARGRIARREMTLEADRVTIGDAPGHTADLREGAVRLTRGEQGWLVAAGRIGGGDLVWAASSEGEARPSGAAAGEGEPAEQADVAAPPERTTARIERSIAALRPAPSDRDVPRVRDATERAERAGTDDRPAWMAALAPDVELELRGVSVAQRGARGGRPKPVVRDLRAKVEGRPEGRLHLAGNGEPSSGGRLRWDLTVAPAELRGEGTIAFERLPLAVIAPLLPNVPWHAPEDAWLDGQLTIRGESPDRLAVRGRVALHGAALESARIAPYPVREIGFAVEGNGAWLPFERRLQIDTARFAMGAAEATIQGAIEWAPDHYLFDLRGELPATDCQTALGAIPHDLLAEIAGFTWTGRIGARFEARVDSRALDDSVLEIRVADGCRFSTIPAAADLQRVQAPFVHRVREPDGSLFEMSTGPGTAAWAPIEAISPFFVHSVLAHEDGGFFGHHGFSVGSIRDALVANLKAKRYVRGASTITMQLAKNLFLQREKTLARKVQEAILTWWLESALPKAQILELYLNVIEYGPAIYGIRSASEHYFGRPPSELTLAQSAFLASILPAPKLYHGQFQRGSISSSMANRMKRLIRHMNARGRIDQTAMDAAIAEVDAFRFGPSQVLQAGAAAQLPLSGLRVGADPWGMFGAPGDVEDDGWSDVPESDPDG